MKLLMLKGLPASGKTSFAKSLVASSKSTNRAWKRVNKDDLRAMIDNSQHSKSNEKFILAMRDSIIEEALTRGDNVVVDDTNFAPKHEEALKAIAAKHKAVFEIQFFDISVEEAIKRDLARPASVGEKVIKGMYRDYLMPPVELYEPPQGVPEAIVVDIDGTLAHMHNRSPYDPTLYHTDTVDEAVRSLVNIYHGLGVKVIICSGRDDTYKGVTSKWLVDNEIKFDEIHMRPMANEPADGKKLKDWIVKQRLFDEHIRKRFKIRFVLDDRNQVVEMWRRNGLKVLQVEEGDF
jgi:predicted kinase